MGEISRRLHRKLTKLAPPGARDVPPPGWRPQEPAPDIPRLIAEGYDPVHAAYIFVHHTISTFSENVSAMSGVDFGGRHPFGILVFSLGFTICYSPSPSIW